MLCDCHASKNTPAPAWTTAPRYRHDSIGGGRNATQPPARRNQVNIQDSRSQPNQQDATKLGHGTPLGLHLGMNYNNANRSDAAKRYRAKPKATKTHRRTPAAPQIRTSCVWTVLEIAFEKGGGWGLECFSKPLHNLGPPVVPFYPFLGEGSPTRID